MMFQGAGLRARVYETSEQAEADVKKLCRESKGKD